MNGFSDSGAFARLVDVEVCQPSTSAIELRLGRLRRSLRMEIRISPWWPRRSPRALVELVPREKRVPLSGTYFAAGHRLLDHVVDELTGPGAGSTAVP